MQNIHNKLKSTNDGIIYPLVDWGIQGLGYLSLVEGFKFVAGILPGSKEEVRGRKNIAIDTFIVFKWSVLLYFWSFGYQTKFHVAIIWYLLAANMHTYFYYHVWVNVAGADSDANQKPRERRRFINVILAFCFSAMCYAYFYHTYYASHFSWPAGISNFTAAMMFSIGTALTGFTGALLPADSTGHLIVATQLAGTFLFLAIILSQSLPQSFKEEIPRGKGGINVEKN